MLVELFGNALDGETDRPDHLAPGYYDRWDSALSADRKLYR